MPKKETAIKHATLLSAYLLIVWGFYRFLFKFPQEAEELFIKPIVWLLPVYYFVKKEKLGLSSLGVTTKNLFPAIYFALGLGVVFAMEGAIVNSIKHGGFDFSANIGQMAFASSLGLSLATAVTEELTFRGYLFNRAWHVLKNETTANLLTSFIWALVHVPIAVFWWELSVPATLGYLLLTTIFGIGSAYVFARTRNVFAPILLHVLWEWPIILFR